MSLGGSDVARELVGNIMVILRGDLRELRERFTITYGFTAEQWNLDLIPRSRALLAIVEQTDPIGQSASQGRINHCRQQEQKEILRFLLPLPKHGGEWTISVDGRCGWTRGR